MHSFDDIIDNSLTSREEVEMEYNAKEAAFQHQLFLCLSDISTALTSPHTFLNGEVSGN